MVIDCAGDTKEVGNYKAAASGKPETAGKPWLAMGVLRGAARRGLQLLRWLPVLLSLLER